MVIQNTPFPELSPALPESRQLHQSAPGRTESMPGLKEAQEETAEPVHAIQTREGPSLLTPGEKQIIDLLFDNSGDDQGTNGFSLYGVQQPRRPAVIGNFLDVRG